MGQLTDIAKDAAVSAVADLITHAALFGVTPVAATASGTAFSATAHGLVTGDVVLLTELVGTSDLVAGSALNADHAAKVYTVVAKTADTFGVNTDPDGPPMALGTVTSVVVNKLAELTTPYARKAVTLGDSDDGGVTFTAPAFDVPACTVGCQALMDPTGNVYAWQSVLFQTYPDVGSYTIQGGSIAIGDAS